MKFQKNLSLYLSMQKKQKETHDSNLNFVEKKIGVFGESFNNFNDNSQSTQKHITKKKKKKK